MRGKFSILQNPDQGRRQDFSSRGEHLVENLINNAHKNILENFTKLLKFLKSLISFSKGFQKL